MPWRGDPAHLVEPVGPASVAAVVGALGAVAAQLDVAAAELGHGRAPTTLTE